MKTKRKERDMSDTKLKGYGEDVFSEEAIRAFLPKGSSKCNGWCN